MILSRSLLGVGRSARAFARAPGLSLALLLTIALGVGSNASIYGFLQGLIHPASPLRGSDRVVSIFRQDRFRGASPLTTDEYQLLKQHSEWFDWVGAARIHPCDMKIGGGLNIATVAAVTPDIAAALKIPLDHGAVLSYRLWASEFEGRTNAVGSHIRVDSADFRIDGVAPRELEGLYSDSAVDLWIPLQDHDLDGGGRSSPHLWVLARLHHDVSTRRAQDALHSGSPGLREWSVAPFTGVAPAMARGLSRVGIVLSFFAATVFLIASINVASLLLGRAFRRSHETSLRIALGATRRELLWALFSDSVVISLAGGAAGLLLGILIAHLIPALLFEQDAEHLSFGLHWMPIVAASVSCAAVTVVCGMLPVFGTVTDRPWMILQRETGLPSKAIQRLRSGLVVAQITACCMLVICTALLLHSLHSAMETSAGHRLGDPILLTVQAQAQPEVDPAYFSKVEQSAKSVAGLTPLAWTARLPGNPPTWRTFRSQSPSLQTRDVAMDIAWLTPESLQRLDNQPVAGRMFGLDDGVRRVAVVNEEAAAELFGPDTVGVVLLDPAGLPIEVIGVVRSKSADRIHEKSPTIYYGYVDRSDAPAPIEHAQFRSPVVPPTAGIEMDSSVVSANYFSALDLFLIAGRSFPEHRVPGAGRVAVINQEAADLYFNGKPIGAAVIDDNGLRTEIIGVVRSQSFGTFEQHAEPAIFFPMWQDGLPRMTLLLKDSKWNNGILAELLHKIESVPGRGPVPVRVNTLDQQLARSGLATLRIATLIGGASAITALILSILGVLSAQSDAEHQRQRERAVRIALGAQRWRIVLMVLKSAGQLACMGTVIATALSFALLRLVMADTALVTSPSLQVWLAALLLPATTIILVSVGPALRASLTSPLAIMRDN